MRFATSQCRDEPAAPARRLAGNEERGRSVRFLATRLYDEPFLAASGKEIAMDASGFSQRACTRGLMWQERSARSDVWLPWPFAFVHRAL